MPFKVVGTFHRAKVSMASITTLCLNCMMSVDDTGCRQVSCKRDYYSLPVFFWQTVINKCDYKIAAKNCQYKLYAAALLQLTGFYISIKAIQPFTV